MFLGFSSLLFGGFSCVLFIGLPVVCALMICLCVCGMVLCVLAFVDCFWVICCISLLWCLDFGVLNLLVMICIGIGWANVGFAGLGGFGLFVIWDRFAGLVFGWWVC